MPLSAVTLPSEEEVANYELDQGDCCTTRTFRPDLRNTMGTPWNTSCANVFVRGYLRRQDFIEKDREKILKAFRKHLNYLHDKYKNESKPEEEREAMRSARARKERRAAVSFKYKGQGGRMSKFLFRFTAIPSSFAGRRERSRSPASCTYASAPRPRRDEQ